MKPVCFSLFSLGRPVGAYQMQNRTPAVLKALTGFKLALPRFVCLRRICCCNKRLIYCDFGECVLKEGLEPVYVAIIIHQSAGCYYD